MRFRENAEQIDRKKRRDENRDQCQERPQHVQGLQVRSYKDPTVRFKIDNSDTIRDRLGGMSFPRPPPGPSRYSDTGPGWTTIRIEVSDQILADGEKHNYAVSTDYKSGSDTYHILTTDIDTDGITETDYVINVHDSGAPDDGTDVMIIEGQDDATGSDVFLVRRNFIARMHGDAEAGTFSAALERINYDESINARVRINTYAGDD